MAANLLRDKVIGIEKLVIPTEVYYSIILASQSLHPQTNGQQEKSTIFSRDRTKYLMQMAWSFIPKSCL